ncbi:hypothetical protein HC891_24435, partial [Candidatus Gracilibacteria bacterium]|nr:hypothetical protein [Candidatus Gracilibacteria bacterium]
VPRCWRCRSRCISPWCRKPAAAERAYNATRDLLALFKADLANRLGVTVTFTDNDGD